MPSSLQLSQQRVHAQPRPMHTTPQSKLAPGLTFTAISLQHPASHPCASRQTPPLRPRSISLVRHSDLASARASQATAARMLSLKQVHKHNPCTSPPSAKVLASASKLTAVHMGQLICRRVMRLLSLAWTQGERQLQMQGSGARGLEKQQLELSLQRAGRPCRI